jgi:hypothetical protein
VSAPTNDGGLAFPGSRMEDVSAEGAALPLHKLVHYPGMTLRDYIATASLPEIFPSNNFDYAEVAKTAYAIADAMLAARTLTAPPQ